MESKCDLRGALGLRPIRRARLLTRWKLRNFLRRWRELPMALWVLLARVIPGAVVVRGELRIRVIRGDGRIEDYGLVGRHLIVTAGKNFMVDAWQNLVEPEIMKFHGIGTGSVAPAAGDTALGTELTTQYSPDNTRATGSLTEGASANVFRTVGTNTVDAAVACTEWGLLSQAATGGGTLFDRQTFAVINLASGDGLQTTYDCTVG